MQRHEEFTGQPQRSQGASEGNSQDTIHNTHRRAKRRVLCFRCSSEMLETVLAILSYYMHVFRVLVVFPDKNKMKDFGTFSGFLIGLPRKEGVYVSCVRAYMYDTILVKVNNSNSVQLMSDKIHQNCKLTRAYCHNLNRFYGRGYEIRLSCSASFCCCVSCVRCISISAPPKYVDY